MNLFLFLVEIEDESVEGEDRIPKLLCVRCKDGRIRKQERNPGF